MKLDATNVTGSNAGSETPYTFELVFSDTNLVDASSLAGSTVEVAPPTGSTITATMVGSPTTSGTANALGDAAGLTVTYQITPPGGDWGTAPAGTYTLTLSGSPVTDLAGNSRPPVPLALLPTWRRLR